MKRIIPVLLFACCLAAPFAGCQTPPVKNAENASLAAAEQCAQQNVLQPVETDGLTLLAKVSQALLDGAGKTALDDGYAQAKADIAALPGTIKQAAITCAIQTAIAAYQPLAGSTGFSGGDARLMMASQIGQKLLADHGGP